MKQDWYGALFKWHEQMILRERILEATSVWMLRLTSTDKFLHFLGRALTMSLGASHVAVLIYDQDNNDYRIRMSYGKRRIPASLIKLDLHSLLIRHLMNKRGIDYCIKVFEQDLKRLGFDIGFPIFYYHRFMGAFLIGPRTGGQSYDKETIHFFRALANDIGAEIEKEDYYQASIKDQLTSLYNRKFFNNAMEVLTEETKQAGGHIALAMIDVDHFKQINDTYGHLAGDEVLKMISDEIHKNVRPNDLCIRYGGEEFCILFKDIVKRDGVLINGNSREFRIVIQKIAMRLKNKIDQRTVLYNYRTIHVTVSIGIAFFNVGRVRWNGKKALSEADKMLYAAKHAGRNRIFSRTYSGYV